MAANLAAGNEQLVPCAVRHTRALKPSRVPTRRSGRIAAIDSSSLSCGAPQNSRQRRAVLQRGDRGTGSPGSRAATRGGPCACTSACAWRMPAVAMKQHAPERLRAAAARTTSMNFTQSSSAPRRHVPRRQHLMLVVPAARSGWMTRRSGGEPEIRRPAVRRDVEQSGSGRDRRRAVAAGRASRSRSVSSSKPTTQVAIDRMPCWRSRRIASRSLRGAAALADQLAASPRRCSRCPSRKRSTPACL